MGIKYREGLELWVWDSGVLEGFAVYINGQLLDEETIIGMKYPIAKPESGAAAIVVKFGGADGGATKIVDTKANNQVVEHQDSGTSHGYIIEV
jgi:hypothetical protein